MTDRVVAHHTPYARWAHILLRIFAGALIIQHGLQKWAGLFGGMGGSSGMAATFNTLPWYGGVIETVGGALILIGLFTRPAAFILAGQMAVAYFLVHAPNGFWPIMNKGEPAVLFCFVFLYFAATGAGAGSLDYIRTRRQTAAS